MSSLSVRQAVRGMTMALVLGLMLTALEMAWSVSRERNKAAQLGGEILELLDGAAAVAVWTFDRDLANRVVEDALTLNAVHGLTLLYDSGDALAKSQRGAASSSVLGRVVFSDLMIMERPLFRPGTSERDPTRAIGTMRLHLDAAVISADLWAFLGNALISGILRNLLLGLALTFVFDRFLTRPLLAMGREIGQIDPARPEDSTITLPAGHLDDELGDIAARVNDMLTRLNAVQGDLRRLSTRDPVTRLPNRALYDEGLATALVRARRDDYGLAVMIVQMRGEALARCGDHAVQHVAQRLRDCVRGADLVARLGTGEFAAVLAKTDAPQAMRVADRVISGLAHGLAVGDMRIDNTPCIGIALYPSEATDAESLTALARSAAMRAAETGTQVQFVTEGLSDDAQDHLDRVDALMSALEENQVLLKYQPVLEVGSGAPRGIVAIPTWPTRAGNIEGLDLVRFAREVGLDISLVDKVLRAAVRAGMEQPVPLPILVRSVERQLCDPEFLTLVDQLRADTDLPADSLALLVTQSTAGQPLAAPILQGLRKRGVQLWLDVSDPETVPIGLLTGGLFTGVEIVAPEGEVPTPLAALISIVGGLDLILAARRVNSSAQWAAMVRAGCKRVRGAAVVASVPLDGMAELLAGLPAAGGQVAPALADPGPTS